MNITRPGANAKLPYPGFNGNHAPQGLKNSPPLEFGKGGQARKAAAVLGIGFSLLIYEALQAHQILSRFAAERDIGIFSGMLNNTLFQARKGYTDKVQTSAAWITEHLLPDMLSGSEETRRQCASLAQHVMDQAIQLESQAQHAKSRQRANYLISEALPACRTGSLPATLPPGWRG